jgi:hypothetical protein
VYLASNPSAMSSSPPRPSPRGRGAALLSVLRKRQKDKISKSEESETTTERSVSTVVEVERAMGAASLEEKSPPKAAEIKERSASPKRANTEERALPVCRRGTGGKEVSLATNFIHLGLEEGKGVFVYNVVYTPPVDNVSKKFGLINQHRDLVGGSRMFDGQRLMLPIRMPENQTVLTSILDRDGSEEKVEIRITYVSKKPMGHPDCLALYNGVFQRVFRCLNLVPIRTAVDRAYFDPSNKNVLECHRLEIWPGYVVSVDEMEGGVLLQCDSSNKVMRTLTVYDAITEKYTKDKVSFLLCSRS